MSKPPNLACLLESFFRHRLIEQRNVSPLTVAAYRDALRLLVLYASRRAKREPCRLEVRDLGGMLCWSFLSTSSETGEMGHAQEMRDSLRSDPSSVMWRPAIPGPWPSPSKCLISPRSVRS